MEYSNGSDFDQLDGKVTHDVQTTPQSRFLTAVGDGSVMALLQNYRSRRKRVRFVQCNQW